MIFKAGRTTMARVVIALSLTLGIPLWATGACAGLNDLLLKSAGHGEIYAVMYLIENGADVNARAQDGTTALSVASLGGHLEIARALISRGADVNARAEDGTTPLMYASLVGHREIVRALLTKGADINARARDGSTALMYASQGGHLEIVRVLIARGADVNARADDGTTALLIAKGGVRQDIVRALYDNGAEDTAMATFGTTAPLPASPHGHARAGGLPGTAGIRAASLPPPARPDEAAVQPEPAPAPVISRIAAPADAPAARPQPLVSEPAPIDAPPATPRPPAAEATSLEQGYTLSAGATVNRARLDALLKKLKTFGLQPVVREEYKAVDVYRLVAGCFAARAVAQKLLADLGRREKTAFIVHGAGQSCVVAASLFTHDAALAGQERLARKGIPTEIVTTQVPLTAWQVTVGYYHDSHAAEAELQRLAGQGIEVALIPLAR